MKRCALILPIAQADYLGNTIIDGLLQFYPETEFKIPEYEYPSPFDLSTHNLAENDFVNYAKEADLIFLIWGKNSTNFKLAEKIGQWNKTIFIDGSELGKNNRFDSVIKNKVLDGTYDGIGKIDTEMLKKCKLYFRREKPYISGIVPLPFGIESRYFSSYKKEIKKDIDFFCIFGQDEYPQMRRHVRKVLIDFCKKNNFSCTKDRTDGFNFDDKRKLAGRDEYFSLLARCKVGISVGGGGFDTARFWEILGNNCILLTERIDIFLPKSSVLDYKRIFQFDSQDDFANLLPKVGMMIRGNYSDEAFNLEYRDILQKHSSKARVLAVFNEAKKAGILN